MCFVKAFATHLQPRWLNMCACVCTCVCTCAYPLLKRVVRVRARARVRVRARACAYACVASACMCQTSLVCVILCIHMSYKVFQEKMPKMYVASVWTWPGDLPSCSEVCVNMYVWRVCVCVCVCVHIYILICTQTHIFTPWKLPQKSGGQVPNGLLGIKRAEKLHFMSFLMELETFPRRTLRSLSMNGLSTYVYVVCATFFGVYLTVLCVGTWDSPLWLWLLRNVSWILRMCLNVWVCCTCTRVYICQYVYMYVCNSCM